jgi:MFS superfamily sulfate permease-like transporter
MTNDPPSTAHSLFAWRADLAPALIVVLISVPLSLGIAIASGVPPVLGLITAAVGGIVIGRLAGSPLQISGPSAGLAVMVLDAVYSHGLEALGLIVLIMGLCQATSGLLKLGQVFRAVSPAVINGMLAGIGILILSAQFHVMVDDAPRKTGLDNLLSIPASFYKGLVPAAGDGTAHHLAALVGVLTLAVVIGMRAIRRGPLSKLPAPLVAVAVGTFVAWFWDLPIRRVDMPDSVLDAVSLPSVATLELLQQPGIWGSALALAFVASAETLLCATAVDAMHEGPRTNYDRELVAQGVGNGLCGLLGSLPTTGVITRSTANVEAGATSRASAIMVGSFLLAILLAFPAALEVVPRASLAALLVYVGYRLVRGRAYAELRSFGRSELVIFGVTVTTIVAVNLLTGIALGFGLTAAKLLLSRRRSFRRFAIATEHDPQSDQTHVHLRGMATFLRLPKLAAALDALPEESEVLLHVDDLDYIDHACLDLLDRWECERLRRRAPVRVQWQTLHHRYHSANPLDATPEQHQTLPPVVEHLLDFLTPRRILIGGEFRDKWDAIDKLCRHLATTRAGLPVDDLIASARKREAEASTYTGHGLMVPHGILPEGRRMTGVMAVSKLGWDLGEAEPVHCIVLLGTPPSQASRHLGVLAAFARLFLVNTDLRDRIIAAETPEQIFSLFQSEDAAALNYAFEARPGDDATAPPARAAPPS